MTAVLVSTNIFSVNLVSKSIAMISRSLLQKAAEQKIIATEQIDPLYQFIQAADSSTADDSTEEPLKFVRSFGDIFITLGIVILAIAINKLNISGFMLFAPVAGFIVIAEWLVKVRRLALPGIALLMAILFFIYRAMELNFSQTSLASLGTLAACSLLFYLRYRMPFSLLPLVASLVAIFITQTGLDIIKNPLILSVIGLIIFAAAMWFDSRDTKRLTHLSDSGFWLHLIAAPLIVHGVMISILLGNQQWTHIINKEILMIVFFSAFFLLALLVDRRAMLVSTQLYVIYALTQLIQNQLSNTENALIYLLMALGLFVIFFGTYWYKVRRLVYSFLATSPIANYIPGLDIQDNKPIYSVKAR